MLQARDVSPQSLLPDSNRRPPYYKYGALPAELRRHRRHPVPRARQLADYLSKPGFTKRYSVREPVLTGSSSPLSTRLRRALSIARSSTLA